jgi:hypothetical protein
MAFNKRSALITQTYKLAQPLNDSVTTTDLTHHLLQRGLVKL